MYDIAAGANSEMVEGYRDGWNPDNPEPSSNRSHSYRYGFQVARFDKAGLPAFGSAERASQLAEFAELLDETPKQS